MARTTRREKDFLPQGFSTEDLELAKWFLDIVAPLYPGALHSHAAVIPVPDKQGRRRPTSLSALFHKQWPHVPMGDILTALAQVGFITPPQRIKESATNEEAGGYVFRLMHDRCQLHHLTPWGRKMGLRSGLKVRGTGQRRH